VSRDRLPPPHAEACLVRLRPSTQKGGTIIAEDVLDRATHERRICDPDGYRPPFYPAVASAGCMCTITARACCARTRTRRSRRLCTTRVSPVRRSGRCSRRSGLSAWTFCTFRREFSSFRLFGGKGGYGKAPLIPDRVLPVSSGDRAIRVSRAIAARRTGPRGSRWSEGEQLLSVIMWPRRLRGTSLC
jgi:hypothetical protein